MGWQQSVFSTLIIEGGTPGSGLFVYSGAPAFGDLIASISAVAQDDEFGNPVPAGITLFNTTFQIENAGQTRTKLDQFGNYLCFNAFGALVYILAPTGDGYFLYADTGSATQGALISSASNQNGTDQFSNPTAAGLVSYVLVSGVPNAVQLNNGVITYITWNGSAWITDAELYSAATGLVSTVPINAESTTPGTAEAWRYVGTAGNPAFGTDWSNRGGGFANVAFKKVASPPNSVWIKGWATASNVAATTLFTLPTGYRPSSGQTSVDIGPGSTIFQWNIGTNGVVSPAAALSGTGAAYIDTFVSLDL